MPKCQDLRLLYGEHDRHVCVHCLHSCAVSGVVFVQSQGVNVHITTHATLPFPFRHHVRTFTSSQSNDAILEFMLAGHLSESMKVPPITIPPSHCTIVGRLYKLTSRRPGKQQSQCFQLVTVMQGQHWCITARGMDENGDLCS